MRIYLGGRFTRVTGGDMLSVRQAIDRLVARVYGSGCFASNVPDYGFGLCPVPASGMQSDIYICRAVGGVTEWLCPDTIRFYGEF